MGNDAKSWRICDDCLNPLAKKLLAIRFRPVFGEADAISLETQGQQPTSPSDIESLYREHHVTRAFEHLLATISRDYAHDFGSRLRSANDRFFALEAKARQEIDTLRRLHDHFYFLKGIDYQRITGDVDKYASPLLIGWLFNQPHRSSPDRSTDGELPTGDELPDDLCRMEVEITNEYKGVREEFRELSDHLTTVAERVRKGMLIPVTATSLKGDHGGAISRSILKIYGRNLSGHLDLEKLDEILRTGLRNKVSTNKILHELHQESLIPDDVTAKTLGEVLGVTSAAVQQTAWWIKYRKGEKQKLVDVRKRRREATFRKNAKG